MTLTYLPDDVDVEAGLLNLGLQVDTLLLVGRELREPVQEPQARHLETGTKNGRIDGAGLTRLGG